MKRPSFQFYPADWRNDPALRACSDLARLLWIELLCIMHEGSPYGFLTLPNGEPISTKMIEKFSNFDQKNYKKISKLFQELEKNGVIKCDSRGRYYSKRMVSDEAERQEWRERQQKHRLKQKPEKPNDVTCDVTEMSQPSSSSPSSSSINTPYPQKGACVFFEKFLDAYPPGHRTGLSAAKRLWKRNGLDGRLDEILAGLEKWKKSAKWKDRGYVSSLGNFVKDELWKSPPVPEKGQSKPKTNSQLATEKWQELVTARKIVSKYDRSIVLNPEDYTFSPSAGGQMIHKKTGEYLTVMDFTPLAG